MLVSRASDLILHFRLISSHSADTLKSARTVSRPRLPFFACLPEIDFDYSLASVHRPNHPLRTLGGGFLALKQFSASRKYAALQRVLQRLSLYTMAVDDYAAGRGSAQNLGLLSEERTLVTHTLLQLTPDMNQPSQPGQELFDLVQITAVIYMLLCVFPVPAAPFQKLVLYIKQQLDSHSFGEEWTQASNLMLWVSCIAGIATTGLDDNTRSWFIDVLGRGVRWSGIDSWNMLRDSVLMHFLWLPITNDRDGEDLWEEIQNSAAYNDD